MKLMSIHLAFENSKHNTPLKQTSTPSPTPVGCGSRGGERATTVHLPLSGQPSTAFRRYALAEESDRSRLSSDLRRLPVIADEHSSACCSCKWSHWRVVVRSESRCGGRDASGGNSTGWAIWSLYCSCNTFTRSTNLDTNTITKVKTSMSARGLGSWSILATSCSWVDKLFDTSYLTQPMRVFLWIKSDISYLTHPVGAVFWLNGGGRPAKHVQTTLGHHWPN